MSFSVSRTVLVSALLLAAALNGEVDAREVPGSEMTVQTSVDAVSAGAEVNLGRELLNKKKKKASKIKCKKRPGKSAPNSNEGNEGDEGNEGNEGGEGLKNTNDGNEGNEGGIGQEGGNEGNEGDEGNEGNEGDEGLAYCD